MSNKEGLTFSELMSKVNFSKKDVLDELINYTALVGIKGEKYFFRIMSGKPRFFKCRDENDLLISI